MGNRISRARAAAVGFAALGALAGLAQIPASAPAADTYTPPPIRHVWLINLENMGYAQNFESVATEHNPYFAQTLTRQGALLRQYYGIGHESLDNYIAQVSGQSPTGDTQGDCFNYRDVSDAGTDPHGQVIGQGCIYPKRTLTLGQQLEAKGLTWKGYMEDMGDNSTHDGGVECAHPPIGGNMNGADPYDGYVQKHNPFLFFHSIIDDAAYCRAHDVPLRPRLVRDLQRVATTPNFTEITPDTFNDGHDAGWQQIDLWLRHYVKLILAAPAYRQDGMVIVTFDESSGFGAIATENTSCCGEIPGPNSPDPGISGPGGGRVGAVVLSPFVKPGTVTDTPYNHYSLLRSLEDLFGTTGGDDGAGHLGFAGSYGIEYPGPGAFGADVYTATPGGGAAQSSGPAITPDEPSPDGSTTWLSPQPLGNDLRSVSCASDTACVAVGDRGATVRTTDGTSWSAAASPTGRSLLGVSCATTAACTAVGNGGTILGTSDGGASWSARKSPTTRGLTSVSCAAATRCVAVGDAGTVVTTTDGTRWSARSSGTPSNLTGVDCPTASQCYAVGDGAIGASKDGGATWTIKTTLWRNFGVSCSGAQTCLVIRDMNQHIYTTDGGTTWQGGGADGWRYISGVSCVRGQARCLTAGEQRWPLAFFPDGSGLGSYQPTDARGQQLGPFTQPSGRQSEDGRLDQLLAASCASVVTCFAVGMHGAIVKVGPLPAAQSDPPAPATVQRSGRIRELDGVSCAPNTTTCVVVGDSAIECYLSCTGPSRTPATVLSTSDGSSWSLADPGTSTPLNGVACATATSCVAVGDLGTVVRTDAGQAWLPVPDPSNTRGDTTLNGVSCATATSCVAVGAQGTVLTSGDGGLTWTAQQSGSGDDLTGVSCSGPACVAVGGRGTVLRSSDGGGSWASVSAGTSRLLTGVSCSSATTCVAVGAAATILRSIDSGATWTSVGSPAPGEDLRSVGCYSLTSCMAAGSGGLVIRSGDGGATWKRRQTGTGRFLTGISCPSAGTCYESGEDGAVLRTTQGKA